MCTCNTFMRMLSSHTLKTCENDVTLDYHLKMSSSPYILQF